MSETSGDSVLWGIIGNMLGVLLGAVIAFGTTWWFAHKAERARNRGLGYALILRANAAANAILELNRVLTKELLTLGTNEHIRQKWQVVQVPTGFNWEHTIEFTPEELTILASAGRHDLINDLAELANLHNILHVITAEYVKRREALGDKLRELSETQVQGTKIATLITGEALQKVAPDVMLVEDLVGQLLEKLQDGSNFIRPLLTKLGPAVRDALKDKRFRMSVDFPNQRREK